jgi:hypothetical protein
MALCMYLLDVIAAGHKTGPRYEDHRRELGWRRDGTIAHWAVERGHRRPRGTALVSPRPHGRPARGRLGEELLDSAWRVLGVERVQPDIRHAVEITAPRACPGNDQLSTGRSGSEPSQPSAPPLTIEKKLRRPWPSTWISMSWPRVAEAS